MPITVVRNVSSDELIVVYDQAGSRVAQLLEAGRQTPDDVSPLAVFSHNGNSILDHPHGWRLREGSTAILYDIESWTNVFGLIDLDMHCVPPHELPPREDFFAPESACEPAEEGEFADLVPDLTTGWGTETAAGEKDGRVEFESTICERLFSDRTLTGKFIRTGDHIAVRLRLTWIAEWSLDDQQALYDEIQTAMVAVWNSQNVPIPSGAAGKLFFRCDAVQSGQDFIVSIAEPLPPDKQEPNNTARWFKDLGYNSIAHEIGHYLGLVDEYYLGADYKKQTTEPERMKSEQEYCPWRHQERTRSGACGIVKNLMEDNWRRASQSGPFDLVVDQKMIDAIDRKRQQGICLRS